MRSPPDNKLEIEVVPLVQPHPPEPDLDGRPRRSVPPKQAAERPTHQRHKARSQCSPCGRTFDCLNHSALSAALLAALLILVAVRDMSFGETTAEGEDLRPQKEDSRGFDDAKSLQSKSREDPLALDTVLGLVPPNKPEGKEYLPLEFVHATKTGGSAIEKAAAKHGIAWGACHYNCASFDAMKCPSRSPPQYFEGRVKATRYVGSMLWHIPPHYWSPNLLDGHRTFTVVRNPYSRAVSEYYNKWDGFIGTDEERNDPANMNAWIQTNLIDRPKGIRYLQHSKYVFDEHGNKVVDIVLRFENLAAEFNQLMESEGLPIRLDDTPFNERTGIAQLGVEDLTNATIRKINDYCVEDFVHFDYEPLLL
jgi:hypothetical protein